MRKFTKIAMSTMAVAAVGASFAFGFAGCSKGDDDVDYTVKITGSSSVSPLMLKLADAYEEKIGKTDVIRITTNDSGTGISDAQQGKNDFGMASRELKSTETGIVSKKICDDGIALIVNKNSTLTDVTMTQVFELYSAHTAIDTVVDAISREDGSGTRGAFDELIKANGTDLKTTGLYSDIVKINSTGSVIERIASNNAATALGYVSMGSLTADVLKTVNALKLDGVEPTVANVVNQTYALSRPFNIVYQSESGLSDAAKAFIDFIMSSEGRVIVEQEGYIKI